MINLCINLHVKNAIHILRFKKHQRMIILETLEYFNNEKNIMQYLYLHWNMIIIILIFLYRYEFFL